MLADFFWWLVESLFGYLAFLMSKKRITGQEWRGIVEKKRYQRGRALSGYGYIVFFREDDGRRRKLRMRRDDFEMYEVGKAYQKNPGTYLPAPVLLGFGKT